MKPLADLAKYLQELLSIAFRIVNILPGITPGGDVEKHSGIFNAQGPGHWEFFIRDFS
jgi:hypothetical protein